MTRIVIPAGVKTLALTTVVRVGIIVAIIAICKTHASAFSDESMPTINSPDTSILMLHGLSDPVREVRLQEYLYQTANFLSDAYADRNENPGGRELRLRTFAREIEQAVIGRADQYDNI